MSNAFTSVAFADNGLAQPANNVYLNAIRNAFILLTLGIAVMAFDPGWSKWSIWMMLLGIFFLAIVVAHYYLLGDRTLFMDLTTFGVGVLIAILIWLTITVYT